MSHNPTVSICIPSYNHARYLPATLESVLGQTFDDIEVVIIDDGSSDESLQIAESYAVRYPSKVRVLTHEGHRNRGISATVNLGVEKARGRYWAGFPSDDVMYPDRIERQVALLESRADVGWTYGHADYIDETGAPRPELGLFGKDISRERDPVESLVQRNVIAGMTVLARRGCIVEAGPHDEKLLYSDWEFWVRLLSNAKVAFIEKPLVKYRVHTYNASVGIDPYVNVRRGLEVMTSLRRKAAATGGALARRRTQSLLDLQLAFHHFCARNVEDAARSLSAAFETDPSLEGDAKYFGDWLRARVYDAFFTFPPGTPEREFCGWAAQRVPSSSGESLKRRAAAAQLAMEALELYETDPAATRRAALGCLMNDPGWLADKPLRSIFVKSLFGSKLLSGMRRLKKPDAQKCV